MITRDKPKQRAWNNAFRERSMPYDARDCTTNCKRCGSRCPPKRGRLCWHCWWEKEAPYILRKPSNKYVNYLESQFPVIPR